MMRTAAGMLVCVVGAATLGTPALAQGREAQVTDPTSLMVSLAVLAVLPFFLVMVTSFVKIAVVLSILRNAVGIPQIPPNQVITGLAMVLSVFIMLPVATDVYDEANQVMDSNRDLLSLPGVLDEGNRDDWARILEPLKGFLERHASSAERELFWGLANRMSPDPEARADVRDLKILIPSFVVTELKEAFLIGFIIFLPFLVVDMVVANILMALGMFMLSPTTVSLPIKLLLFVMVDGWYMITRGLVLSYFPG